MRIVVFDVETRKHTKQLSDDREEGFRRLRNGDGGMSAMCLFDFQENWLYLYDDNPLSLRAAVSHLEAADVVVGYCSKRFDIPCVEGLTGRRLRIGYHLDIYRTITHTLGQRGIVGQRGDYTLDAVCRRTFGRGKNGVGTSVSDLVQQGRYGEIFNYCGNDVRLTRDLLLHVARHGRITTPTRGSVTLFIPDGIRRALNVWNELPHPTGSGT